MTIFDRKFYFTVLISGVVNFIYVVITRFWYLATVPVNASSVPETPLDNTADVIEKTFHSLTFEWNGTNSALNNASSVYLMTLKTSASWMEEERVLGLVSELAFNAYLRVMMNPRSYLAFDLLRESPRKRELLSWGKLTLLFAFQSPLCRFFRLNRSIAD